MHTHQYILLATMALALAACSQEEAWQADGNHVQGEAAIASLLTRVAGDDGFAVGEKIEVENTSRATKRHATFTLGSDGWATTDTLAWNIDGSANHFRACFPEGSLNEFSIPLYQHTDELLRTADWLMADTTYVAKPSDDQLALNFKHQLAKVILHFTYNTEYAGENTIVLAAYIRPSYDLDGKGIDIPYHVFAKVDNASQTVTAILPPGTHEKDSQFFQFNVSTTGGASYNILDADLNEALTLEAGKAYAFNVLVGREKVVMSGAAVAPWKTGDAIDAGEAEETAPKPCLKCPDDNHPHAIDLGLPSGTMWACCNMGAKSPTEYGGYYAWGETEEKNYYGWNTYAYCDGSQATCHNIGSDIAGTQYDVAHVKWGSTWRMPTIEQFEELNTACTWTWKEAAASGYGLAGYIVEGSTGGAVFLPAASQKWNDNLNGVGQYGYYYSSTRYISYAARHYYFYSGNHFAATTGTDRAYGLSVRAVCN